MANQQGTFAIDVAKWCEKAKENADTVLRGVVVELLTRVVLRTPVGNPDLWKANAGAVYRRETFNLFAERVNQRATIFNANLVAAGEVTKSGRVRGAQKLVKLKSGKALQRSFPNVQGKGYVGGALRGSWQITIGTPARADNQRIDPGGSTTIAAGAAAVAAAKVGPAIFIVSNKPYARRIEFEGWSKQAPAGMIRVTAAEFSLIVDEQARALPQ